MAGLISLAALLLVTGWLVVRPGFLARAAWVLNATAWWLLNKSLEGPILLRLTDDSGVTLADVLPLLCIAAVMLARYRRQHSLR
ncbi:hypothetical protein [Nocardioides sp.]|uniref:hypothetical protein n=1 Tax=Nocardioides sp. TaxID=35761 RepID=UPI003D1300FE